LADITPKKGDYAACPSTSGKARDTWDPSKGGAAGEQLQIVRRAGPGSAPTRLRLSWQDDQT
jgi:hypothetical protein